MNKKETISTFGEFKTNSSDIEQINRYFNLFKCDKNLIEDEIYNDLNIEDLFNYSNRCITPMGEMLLYYKLRHFRKVIL